MPSADSSLDMAMEGTGGLEDRNLLNLLSFQEKKELKT